VRGAAGNGRPYRDPWRSLPFGINTWRWVHVPGVALRLPPATIYDQIGIGKLCLWQAIVNSVRANQPTTERSQVVAGGPSHPDRELTNPIDREAVGDYSTGRNNGGRPPHTAEFRGD
jgi:hypothetical protein